MTSRKVYQKVMGDTACYDNQQGALLHRGRAIVMVTRFLRNTFLLPSPSLAKTLYLLESNHLCACLHFFHTFPDSLILKDKEILSDIEVGRSFSARKLGY